MDGYMSPFLSLTNTSLFLYLPVFKNKGIWSWLGERHNALCFNGTVK